MRVDKRLHLVIPIYEDEEGGKISAYVHSSPLSEDMVDQYFFILGQTYAMVFSRGLGIAAGPAHALRILRHVATEAGQWEDDPVTKRVGVKNGLVEEIRRLTNLAIQRDGKWEVVPISVAANQGWISADDKSEVENAIVFFIVSSATLGRAQRRAMVQAGADLWGAAITPLDTMAWVNSLRTSKGTATSARKSHADVKDDDDSATVPPAGKVSSVPV